VKYSKKGDKIMGTIITQGQELRKAVKWISDQRRSDNQETTVELIQQAGLMFNLSPADEEYLARNMK
jgi:hypothetical protein